jgi:hypothetical protein
MSNTNTGGPAFPGVDEQGEPYNGMTLRDYFAAKAIQGFVAAIGMEIDFSAASTDAYAIADAMLKAREV